MRIAAIANRAIATEKTYIESPLAAPAVEEEFDDSVTVVLLVFGADVLDDLVVLVDVVITVPVVLDDRVVLIWIGTP
jgi:hypothetical protein